MDRDARLRLGLPELLAGCAQLPMDQKFLHGFVLHCIRVTLAARALGETKGVPLPIDESGMRALGEKAHVTITYDEIGKMHRGEGLEAEQAWIQSVVGERGVPALPEPTLNGVMQRVEETLKLTKDVVAKLSGVSGVVMTDGVEDGKGELAQMFEKLRAISQVSSGGFKIWCKTGLNEFIPDNLNDFGDELKPVVQWMFGGFSSDRFRFIAAGVSNALGGKVVQEEGFDVCFEVSLRSPFNNCCNVNARPDESPVGVMLKALYVHMCRMTASQIGQNVIDEPPDSREFSLDHNCFSKFVTNVIGSDVHTAFEEVISADGRDEVKIKQIAMLVFFLIFCGLLKDTGFDSVVDIGDKRFGGGQVIPRFTQCLQNWLCECLGKSKIHLNVDDAMYVKLGEELESAVSP